ncbi:hypothetical protein [Sigmofec virus UA08Rod_4527]|uniref:Peptidase M15A C-terminal domain-containing protein n=1 Tax=Sigmofec virus UA08Rod_4527 TaxID=2929403 RepID=A0A976N103_9VIRU|nr:hypothetical protein [Sigmofec virus UA08Rod_4527]
MDNEKDFKQYSFINEYFFNLFYALFGDIFKVIKLRNFSTYYLNGSTDKEFSYYCSLFVQMVNDLNISSTLLLYESMHRVFSKVFFHFTLSEFFHSSVAELHGKSNFIKPRQSSLYLNAFITFCYLENIRKLTGPLVITSGYRSAPVNKLVSGAVPNSFHIRASACDIRIPYRVPTTDSLTLSASQNLDFLFSILQTLPVRYTYKGVSYVHFDNKITVES